MNPLNTTKIGSTIVVGGIAAWQSYWHMHDLVIRAGENRMFAEWMIPLSVDGMMLVATTNMIQAKRNGRKPSVTSWIALGVGMVGSLAANVASADSGALSRVVAGWPAIAVMLVVEMLARKGKKVDGPVDTSVLSDTEIAKVSKPRKGRPVAETRAMANHIWASNPTLTRADVATRLGISDSRLAEVMRATSKV
jgi:uncharacterized protein DUF2637